MSMAVESLIVEDKPEEKPVDREKTCPLLLRVFCNTSGRHHSLTEYSRGSVPANELQIYTWMDATLNELTTLVREVNPDARKKGTIFDHALVVPATEPDHRGLNMRINTHRLREIGTTITGTKGMDDNKTLQQCRFTIGDFLDIAITLPSRGPPGDRRRMRQY